MLDPLIPRADYTTSISPSIYISYTNLIATVFCGSYTQGVNTGREYNTLIAYPPEALSSVTCTTHPRKGIGTACSTKTLDYAQMQQLPYVLAFPPNYTLIDPEWKLTCTNSRLGLHDPPRTLSKTPYLVDPTSVVTQTPTAVPGAKPAPGPTAATPTPTTGGGGKDPAEPPTTSLSFKGSDPPTVSVLNSAAISSSMHNLHLGGKKNENPPKPDDLDSKDGKDAGDPQGTVSHTKKHPVPGTTEDPEDFRGASNKPPANDDLPLPSSRWNQVQEADQSQASVLTAGYTIIKASNGEAVTGSSTYPPGSQTTFPDRVLSVGVDNVVRDSSTYALPINPTDDAIFVDSNPITRAPNGGVIIGDSTIVPGGQAALSGHTIVAGVSSVILDGSTFALPTSVGAVAYQSIASTSITLANGVVISAGDRAAIISGTTYSIPTEGSGLIMDDKTMGFRTRLQSVFTIAGQALTANPTGFGADGHSILLHGSAVTHSGTLISLRPSGVQVGSSTFPPTPTQATHDVGLASLIVQGFGHATGSAGGATNLSSPLAFLGGSVRLRAEMGTMVLAVWGLGIGAVVYML